MLIETKFALGDLVEDLVTGWRGVVLALSQQSTGCRQYGLQSPRLNADGDVVQEWDWFGEGQLSLVQAYNGAFAMQGMQFAILSAQFAKPAGSPQPRHLKGRGAYDTA